MNENDKPIFDKAYCDNENIRAEWFKFDRSLAEFLIALVEEGTNEKGEWGLNNSPYLSSTIYAILRYFLDGSVPQELEILLNKPSMKLSKLALTHAKRNVEEARSRVAENRHNGGLRKNKG